MAVFSCNCCKLCGNVKVAMEEKNYVVQVHENLKNMMEISADMEHWKKRSIYKLPAAVRDLNRKAFDPQVVSFGPYHHGKSNLKAIEEHKRRALCRFLVRSDKPLESLVQFLAEVVEDLKDSYYPLHSSWKDDTARFLQLMIIDGCFMIEMFITAKHGFSGYEVNDPIFSNHGKLYIMPYIGRDMLMLENQLPKLLLDRLFAFEGTIAQEEESINKLIIQFFPSTILSKSKLGRCLHVLDLYRKSLLQHDPPYKQRFRTKRWRFDRGLSSIIARSAIELQEAGIRFRKSRTTSLKDISFDGGVLTLPPIVVDDTTESTFFNLLAYERLHVGAGNEVTSYTFLMDNIIDSEMDVAILSSNGIIQNAVGSDEAVSKLFNSLAKDTALDPESPLEKVQQAMNYYCRKPWNRWRANLIHTYFQNPWALISLVAAILLFALTIVQTVYTIYPILHPDPDNCPPGPPPPPKFIPRRPPRVT